MRVEEKLHKDITDIICEEWGDNYDETATKINDLIII